MDEVLGFGPPVQPTSAGRSALWPLPGGSVRLEGGFWGERQLRNREITIPHGIEMLEEWGSLENLRVAAGKSASAYNFPVFMDSDVYKVLEAIAWDRQHGPAPVHERFFARAAALLADAQGADGYLNSYVEADHPGTRFADPAMGHELYCAGHLFQAAVAEARGPHSEALLGPIAQRFASYLVETMAERPAFVPGHPEVEMALVESYRQWGSRQLLDLAADLAGRRGRSTLSHGSMGPEYFQDEVELTKAHKVRGHAVRALYLLCGAADLHVETGRQELLDACRAQWEDMASSKTYITGGVGSRHKDEAFGEAFELPPDRAYCETCAAAASFMWNWRMTLATGDARYAELAERTLYNGLLSGWGLDGKSFFYVNALQSRNGARRQPWYRVACCPPNIMRLVASLEHYVASQGGASQGGASQGGASQGGASIQIHQFMPATISAPLPGGAFRAKLETAYPREGWLVVRIEEAPESEVDLAVRVPSWAHGFEVELNNAQPEARPNQDGYFHVSRSWRRGDELFVSFRLQPRWVWPDRRIDAVRGCAALELGPFVYCYEAPGLPDSAGRSEDLTAVVTGAPVRERAAEVAGEVVTELNCKARNVPVPATGAWPYYATPPSAPRSGTSPPDRELEIAAIPYYTRANREPSLMRVWAPEVGQLDELAAPTG